MVTCYSHFFLQPPSKATLLSLFIVTFCCCFLLSRSEVAPVETFFAASSPGADNHNARFGLRLNVYALAQCFIKRLLEILNQVIRIFNADRHSNEMIANSHLRATLWPHFIENRVRNG